MKCRAQFCKTVTTQSQRFRQTPDESLTSGDAVKQRQVALEKHSASHRLCVEERIAMKTKSIVLLAVLLTGSAHVASAADNLSAALQTGLLEEEANHNLDAAIQAYQSVINQFDDQRKIAATAIFRLGECYRKQGKTNEAVLQYQRVGREFADQDTLVKLSAQYLSAPGISATTFDQRLRQNTAQASLDEESKEIQRLKDIIKNSPDLINAKDFQER